MNDFWATVCLWGWCASPIFCFLAGLIIGRKGLPFRIRLEKASQSGGDFSIDAGE